MADRMSRTVRCHRRLSSLLHMQSSAVRPLCTGPRSPGDSSPRPPRPQHAARGALLHLSARDQRALGHFFHHFVVRSRALPSNNPSSLRKMGGRGIRRLAYPYLNSSPSPPPMLRRDRLGRMRLPKEPMPAGHSTSALQPLQNGEARTCLCGSQWTGKIRRGQSGLVRPHSAAQMRRPRPPQQLAAAPWLSYMCHVRSTAPCRACRRSGVVRPVPCPNTRIMTMRRAPGCRRRQRPRKTSCRRTRRSPEPSSLGHPHILHIPLLFPGIPAVPRIPRILGIPGIPVAAPSTRRRLVSGARPLGWK